ncbi:MAG: flagellar hook-basal body complex protein FliE, partial [Candidatus Eisenbacteria bacterium]|nr:flagellar hook-basal body complex protein FliE [Candidatus Eisenbacteria bacterium]
EFLQEVNGRQLRADAMTRGYARGDVQDLHKVVLAQQDAAVSLRLLVQMRNRVISAYQEILRMQV